MSRSEFHFSHALRVRWSEVDMQGVVFNGHYLTYFDVAFNEYWRATGLPSPEEQAKTGCELFARKCTIEYHASARFDEMLVIYVGVRRLGRSSMTVALEIHHESAGDDSEALITGELVYVFADTRARRATPLPSRWRERFNEMEHGPIET